MLHRNIIITSQTFRRLVALEPPKPLPFPQQFRECIAPPISSENRLQTVKQYRPLDKKAHEDQTKPHFLMIYRTQETVPK